MFALLLGMQHSKSSLLYGTQWEKINSRRLILFSENLYTTKMENFLYIQNLSLNVQKVRENKNKKLTEEKWLKEI